MTGFNLGHSHPEDLHHLIPEVVDDFDGDAAGGWLGEGPGGVAVERFPGFQVDLGFEGGLESFVGVVGTEKVSVAHEEAFLVVVGVDKPAGDAVGVVATDFSGVGVEDIHAVDSDL